MLFSFHVFCGTPDIKKGRQLEHPYSCYSLVLSLKFPSLSADNLLKYTKTYFLTTGA